MAEITRLIAAHRTAYDKWELLLGPADARPPKAGAVKARDAASLKEQASLDALLAALPQTIKEVREVARHLVKLEKDGVLPGNALERLLRSLACCGFAAVPGQPLPERGLKIDAYDAAALCLERDRERFAGIRVLLDSELWPNSAEAFLKIIQDGIDESTKALSTLRAIDPSDPEEVARRPD